MRLFLIFSFLVLAGNPNKCFSQDYSSKSTKEAIAEYTNEVIEHRKKISNPETTKEERLKHIEAIIELTKKIRKRNKEDVEKERQLLEDAKKQNELTNSKFSIMEKILNAENLTKEEAEVHVHDGSNSIYSDYSDLQKSIKIKKLMGLQLSISEKNELEKIAEKRRMNFEKEQKEILENYKKLAIEKNKQEALDAKKPKKKAVKNCFNSKVQEINCDTGEILRD